MLHRRQKKKTFVLVGVLHKTRDLRCEMSNHVHVKLMPCSHLSEGFMITGYEGQINVDFTVLEFDVLIIYILVSVKYN